MKSESERGYTGGGVGTAGSAERFGPALDFFATFLGQAKKVDESLA